ncbi:serine/threonine-protein phosphatase 7-like isoform X2 [Chenopodium quinoa]|uniref:serine/threonine-protein phosphatase 7-like isoform X2 n=1 Tax=Chenopodium quinoa TaxID=63459 RepID=UPI000B797159|nr:serine/threonine-protein phosphatase 7-like isoform X2 [Chenopodium quinoa]
MQFDSDSSASTTATNHQSPPPIQWPQDGTLTLDWVLNLMFSFDWSSRNLSPTDLPSILPVPDFDKLILCGSKILHKEPNCVRIDDVSSDSRVVVVGDVHGQLHDVIFLLNNAGLPSDNRIFVFNGDYVDRGAWGFETFVLLLAWKIYLPNRVYLLRGNHESKYCTGVYGFEKEVMTKYGSQGKHVYRKCLGCFEGLPLTTVIAGQVYTAHGGVFRSVTAPPSKRKQGKKRNRKISINSEENSDDKLSLGSFEELSRARRIVLDPPWEGSNLIPGDVLWSDPSPKPGLSPNAQRGIGLLWGPDCTDNFLKKFNLKLIIRSHEGPDAREKRPDLAGMDQGYTIDHDVESGKVITLFSAPDYPQFQANPYYDFEEVLDSDEELDLASMVSSS